MDLDKLMINMHEVIRQNETIPEVIEAWKNWGMDYSLGIQNLNPISFEQLLFGGFLSNLYNDYLLDTQCGLVNEYEIPLLNNIRVKEYNYDNNDKCKNCGSCEKSETEKFIGYCTKLNEMVLLNQYSCDTRLVL